jgi:hypothetical protein
MEKESALQPPPAPLMELTNLLVALILNPPFSEVPESL